MIFKNRSPTEIEYKKPLLEIKNTDILCFNSNNKMNNAHTYKPHNHIQQNIVKHMNVVL